jgi:hypothetical protein
MPSIGERTSTVTSDAVMWLLLNQAKGTHRECSIDVSHLRCRVIDEASHP